ncbi:hypothetical protein EMGBS4_18160 [Acidimicrobiaceae bacterium]|nr:hypothetical protein EMGBS4_18160 [Acidimicrobiaceae bacterium]
METTMFSDNRVLVNKLAYRIGNIDRGDVVVFDRAIPNGNEVQHDDLIKRVIALGGENDLNFLNASCLLTASSYPNHICRNETPK